METNEDPTLHYMTILPGDTLLSLAPATNGNDYHIGKAFLPPEGITWSQETVTDVKNYPFLISLTSHFHRNLFEWNAGWALNTVLRTDLLELYRQNLIPETNYSVDTIGKFPWRDYIWRSYTDAYVSHVTLYRHKDGGYVVCVYDPVESSTTHIIRLDEEGVPIDPAELKGGGNRSARHFEKLPASAESYVDLDTWYHFDPQIRKSIYDSAHVVFWGCDDEGHLYTYRQVKRY